MPRTRLPMSFSRAAALTFGAAIGLSLLAAPPASSDILNGRIAYDRYVEYTDDEGFPRFANDLFTSNLDGTGEVNITATDVLNEMQAAWSQDGARIAFSSDRDGNYDIYTMAADGSDVRQVTFTFGI